MADKPDQKPIDGKKPKPVKPKVDYTTFRIFAQDGANLSDLADARDRTIAELYNELFAETVRKMLIAERERHLGELRTKPTKPPKPTQ